MSSWNADALALINSGRTGLIVFIEMDFSTPLYLVTAAANIDWGGQTWLGIGNLGAIQTVKDATNGDTSGIQFELSGVPSENISLALTYSARNKACKVYLGIFDPDTWQLADVQMLWSGVLDQMPIKQDGDTCTIGVTAEHRGKLFGRVKALRYTDSDQQRISPGDTSMRFLVSQSNHNDVWPSAAFGKQ